MEVMTATGFSVGAAFSFRVEGCQTKLPCSLLLLDQRGLELGQGTDSQ